MLFIAVKNKAYRLGLTENENSHERSMNSIWPKQKHVYMETNTSH